MAQTQTSQHIAPTERHFAVELARAFAGALLFSIAMFMTMEMWWIGFYADRLRLALFTAVTLVLLVRLAHDQGFEESVTWRAAVVDAFVGYAVGLVCAAVFLSLFGVITPGMAADEVVGKLAIQAVPGSIGALLARSQLGGGGQAARPGNSEDGTGDGTDDQGTDRLKATRGPEVERYGGELFLMVVGALFLAFNVAPTEEMVAISYMITPWHAVLLVLLSLGLLHAFVYEVDFRGQQQRPAGQDFRGFWALFLRYTVTGYALVLLVSLYLLWTFGRTDATALPAVVMMTVVVAFPGAVGAAAARLIL